MKNVLITAMVLLLIVIVSACLVKYFQAKTLDGYAISVPKDYSVPASGKPAAKPAGNAAAKGTADVAPDKASDEASDTAALSKSIVISHSNIKLDQIPLEWIEKARKELHIAYGHTSHGSQLISGMLKLAEMENSPFVYNSKLQKDSLDLRDNPFGGYWDLGNPDNKAWAAETRKYLEKNKDINVVMWSWCGQLSYASKGYVNNYLQLMQKLEKDYPEVKFVYMTGHLDGSGEKGTLAKNNTQIRDFCINNDKVLYDFADIESYNPDGVYFGDKYANDACAYDSNGDKKQDKNWAEEWQNTHKEGVDWYQCEVAHSQPVNANMKAYGAWWLMARLAGWDGIPSADAEE